MLFFIGVALPGFTYILLEMKGIVYVHTEMTKLKSLWVCCKVVLFSYLYAPQTIDHIFIFKWQQHQ